MRFRKKRAIGSCLEALLELGVLGGVDDWVEGGGGVDQPYCDVIESMVGAVVEVETDQ